MKKWKKRLLVSGVCVVLAAGVVWNILSYNKYDFSHLVPKTTAEAATDFHSTGTDPKVKGMEIAAQSDSLELLVNPKTTEVAVLDKRTGKVWYSNPQDRANDKVANELAGNSLASQMDITYYDETRQELNFSNYSDSIKKNQFKIQSLKNGVRVTYTLGNLSLGADAIPKYISKQRMQEKVLGKVKNSKYKKAITQSYMEDPNQKDRMMFLESTKNSDINMNRVLSGFQEAGYSSKDLEYDNKQAGIKVQSDLKYVVVPLEYRLDGDKLSVTVPTDQIQEKGNLKLLYIEPMKFFGAGSTKDNGYLFVPSGSGGLINFNNGKTKEDLYMQPVYGEDLALGNGVRTQVTEPVRMPVFGIKNGNDAVLAYIEQGDSEATILAGVSGKTNSYNYVYPRFTLRSTDKVEVSEAAGTNSSMSIVENDLYRGNLKVNYCFLPQKDADYSGMARYYRDVLTKNGTLKPLSKTDAVPFYLDIVGAVEKQEFFVGVPYRGAVTMTTYQQAEEILSNLRKNGVKNVQMRYLGWFNKGINNDVPSSVNLIGSLGGKDDLLKLNQSLSTDGGRLFPDVSFQQISYKTHNYREPKDSARYLDQWSVESADYDRAKLRMDTLYESGVFDTVSPNTLPSIIDQFVPKYRDIGLKNLSIRDLGDLLTSDKRRTYPINREASKYIVIDQLKKLQKDNQLVVSGGNAYSLAYTKSLVNVPYTGNQYYLLDESIPFYEMVIHGSIDYSGEAGNLTEAYDSSTQLLRMLEFGMSPHYMFSYQNGSELSNTSYDSLYSTDYRYWMNDASDAYQKVNGVSSKLRTAKINDFIIHKKGVYETVYDNGVSVYVNYTDQPVQIGSVTVNAKGYALGGYQN